MGERKGSTPTISRLNVMLGTLIGVRECLSDALEFANRGIETARRVIEEQTGAEAPSQETEPRRSARMMDEEILQFAVQWRRTGRTWPWIADELNRRGYRKRRGGKWAAATIQQFHTRLNKITNDNGQTKAKV